MSSVHFVVDNKLSAKIEIYIVTSTPKAIAEDGNLSHLTMPISASL